MVEFNQIGKLDCAPSRKAELAVINQNTAITKYNNDKVKLFTAMKFVETIESTDQNLLQLIADIQVLNVDQEKLAGEYGDVKDKNTELHHGALSDADWEKSDRLIKSVNDKQSQIFEKIAKIEEIVSLNQQWTIYEAQHNKVAKLWDAASIYKSKVSEFDNKNLQETALLVKEEANIRNAKFIELTTLKEAAKTIDEFKSIKELVIAEIAHEKTALDNMEKFESMVAEVVSDIIILNTLISDSNSAIMNTHTHGDIRTHIQNTQKNKREEAQQQIQQAKLETTFKMKLCGELGTCDKINLED